jgi:hypothetical protein
MIYGVGKPIMLLKNGSGTTVKTLAFSYHADKIQPSFIPDMLKQKMLDNTLVIYNRGHNVEFDVYFPMVADSDFIILTDIIKNQFTFDIVGQFSLSLQPRSDHADVYTGYITTPLNLINEFHFLNHGLKFKFEGSSRLAQNEFLVTS